MTRKLKTLGLALVAVFAMSAVVASAASATDDTFTSTGNATTTLTGTQVQENRFTLAGQSVTCKTATFEVTATSPEAEVKTVVPTYGDCSYGGGVAEVHMNGCKYNLTGKTDPSGDAQVSIVDCNTDSHIEITAKSIKCVITVKAAGATDGNQVAEEGVKYTHDGSGTTTGVLIDLTAKVKVSSHPEPGQGEGITCASLTNNTGTLDGTVTVTGEETAPPFNHIGFHIA